MPRKRPITVERPTQDLYERAMLENAKAQAEQNAANIDYIAMMTDVEIPTEEQRQEGNNDL